MTMDEQRHLALPMLYGAPAYARPPVLAVATTPRPFDPDDLPLAAAMTAEELEALETDSGAGSAADAGLEADGAPRAFRLRRLTDLFRDPAR
jgi:hypothetical protein